MSEKTPGEEFSPGHVKTHVQQWRSDQLRPLEDLVVEEVPVALVYNGISQAVMMTTPCDLQDFAIGFSLTEGIIDNLQQIFDIQLTQHAAGYEIALQISGQKMQQLKQYKRSMTGNSGCGLCGMESLSTAIRPGKIVNSAALPDAAAIQSAISSLPSWQPIQAATGACPAAMWCDMQGNKLLVREDGGRHNAFDKLIGAMAANNVSSEQGFAVISSRASYEMVHKASFLQCPTLVAVSAPTSLAITQAKQLNINLIGFARSGRHNIYHSCMSETADQPS
ncbi:MAG: formate dehydrogenase accessory sulfurtransferase FdhD [Pseudomonadales bacterium]|nr:formate dehydrogenase accessory sulfurtransferase FdhD [Pseudomonadales bacterium]